ncbi:hypothetical protein JTE90_015679 [Oedothorax gibbosus]|uniref:BMP and activin membrane-bound inhibitor homolog n=1 Tax=Oedothorax gibbosus TaxID=931172 RepID=A0AAV6U1C9_9ARAC|nr:hypothetical protein JTE90_015679 [Oedothorax gibbosus]
MLDSELGTTRFLSMCLQTALLLLSIFHTGISSVKADVRCYCNLPACVTSGYMCKSSAGICISDHFGFNGDLWQSRHACLELVENVQQMEPRECPKTLPDIVLEAGTIYPATFCCREDMCNYFRNAVDPENPVYRLNHSYMSGILTNDDYVYRHGGKKTSRQHDISVHQKVWFKAAVITVPIAGGLILIMLIVMAARMLNEDYKRHREWTRRRGTQDTRVVYNGEKPTSLLVLPKSLSCAMFGHDNDMYPKLHKGFASTGSIGQPNSLYKDVSIALSTDSGSTDESKDNYFVFDF